MTRPPPEDIAAAAHHVAYELEVLVTSALAVKAATVEDAGWPIDPEMTAASYAENNGLLEACLLHTRNLTDFLILTGRAGDVRRTDFVANWAPPKSEHTRYLRSIRPLLDKHLAHITWDRVLNPTKPWDHYQITRSVLHVFAAFLAALKDSESPHLEKLRHVHNVLVTRFDDELERRSRGGTT